MAIKCGECGGPLEASGKVYFDVGDGAYTEEGLLAVTELEFSILNDRYDGHPVALYDELKVTCRDCGQEVPATLENIAGERFERQQLGS